VTTAPPWPARAQDDVQAPSQRARWLLLVVIVDVVVAAWYFSWLLSPRQIGTRWLYAVLVAVELFNLVQAVGLWWTVRPRRDRQWWSVNQAAPRWFGAPPPVDVLIPTYDEAVEVVEPTVRAALALVGARVNVCLLDDGDRPVMAALAARLRVRYIARPSRAGAKAGNLNHALAGLSAPFVAVFDCDHVPAPGFFVATLGYFHVPTVAYVQTPQSYANRSVSRVAAAAAAQQDFFYGPVARGRDRARGMFCCGTNVIFRRAAVENVGGFPEDSLTEDFKLSIRLAERNWQSAYVPTVLAEGLGPEDMNSYVTQQARWAQGCVGQIPRILFGRLPLRLRAQYLLAASSFLAGFTTFVYLTLPLLRIFGGIQPIQHGAAGAFLIHFLPYFAASVLTISITSDGTYSFGAYSLGLTCFWVHLVAVARCVTFRRTRFKVTPKQGSTAPQIAAVLPALIMTAALAVAVVYELGTHHGPVAFTTVAYALVWIVVLLCGSWDALAIGRNRQQAGNEPRGFTGWLQSVIASIRPSTNEVR
jgi:cellulose synthase (UDP-forming)